MSVLKRPAGALSHADLHAQADIEFDRSGLFVQQVGSVDHFLGKRRWVLDVELVEDLPTTLFDRSHTQVELLRYLFVEFAIQNPFKYLRLPTTQGAKLIACNPLLLGCLKISASQLKGLI